MRDTGGRITVVRLLATRHIYNHVYKPDAKPAYKTASPLGRLF